MWGVKEREESGRTCTFLVWAPWWVVVGWQEDQVWPGQSWFGQDENISFGIKLWFYVSVCTLGRILSLRSL